MIRGGGNNTPCVHHCVPGLYPFYCVLVFFIFPAPLDSYLLVKSACGAVKRSHMKSFGMDGEDGSMTSLYR